MNDAYGFVSLTPASVVGDSGPIFLSPGGAESLGAHGGIEGINLHGVAAQDLAELLGGLGINLPGLSPPKGWDPWQDIASGVLHVPDPSGGSMPDLLSHNSHFV